MTLTQGIVRELLAYDRTTGDLRWKVRDARWFKSDRAHKRWNTRYAGKPAFTYRCHGKRWGCVLNQNMLAHRVVWLWMTGRLPLAVGFRNDLATDLRWSNLIEYATTAAVRKARQRERIRLVHPAVKHRRGKSMVQQV